MFERVVGTCIAVGLVGGEAFSIDASLIKADVDQTKRMPGDEAVNWPQPEEASRAIAEYLAALDAARGTEASDDGDNDGKPPKQISLTDPQAAWMARKKMSPFFAWSQLPDRQQARHHRRCRRYARQPQRRDRRHRDDDRAGRPTP